MTFGAVAAARRRSTSTAVPSPITIMSSGYSIINNSASPSITFSGYTPVLNDLVIFFPRDASADASITIPSGWVNPLGGTTKVSSGSNQSAALYHLVTAAEVSAGTATYSATNFFAYGIYGSVVGSVLRGSSTGAPVIATTFGGSGSTPHVIPGLTGSSLPTGSLVLGAVSRKNDGAYGGGPGGWTQITSTASWSSTWYGQLTAGTTAGVDVPSATVTPSVADFFTGITIAFAAPASPSAALYPDTTLYPA